jgi:hypothetical protein
MFLGSRRFFLMPSARKSRRSYVSWSILKALEIGLPWLKAPVAF